MNNGEWLRQQLDNQGFNIDEAAYRAGVGRSTLWRWLNNPDLDKKRMKIVADAIGIDLRDSLEGFDSFYEKAPETVDYKKKYVELLEENRDLNNIVRDYEEMYGKLPGQKRDKK